MQEMFDRLAKQRWVMAQMATLPRQQLTLKQKQQNQLQKMADAIEEPRRQAEYYASLKAKKYPPIKAKSEQASDE